MTKKDDWKQHLLRALTNNTLLTDKHDPNKLEIMWNKDRTVISHQVADNLYKFIDVGIDKIFEYQNRAGKYYEIILKSNYEYASSGVIVNSTTPYEGFNRIVAVNGKKQKWHIYGEDSKVINKKFETGKLKEKIELL